MRSAMRVVLAVITLLAALPGAASAQRTASPGKYKFSGTIAGNQVSGWFEVDIEGALWLSDATCTASGSSYGSCAVPSVKIRRVRSANLIEVLVELHVRTPGTGTGIRGAPAVRKYAGTLSARRA